MRVGNLALRENGEDCAILILSRVAFTIDTSWLRHNDKVSAGASADQALELLLDIYTVIMTYSLSLDLPSRNCWTRCGCSGT